MVFNTALKQKLKIDNNLRNWFVKLKFTENVVWKKFSNFKIIFWSGIATFWNFYIVKNLNFIGLQYFAISLKRNASHVNFFLLKMESYMSYINSSCCIPLTFKINNRCFSISLVWRAWWSKFYYRFWNVFIKKLWVT